MWNSDTYAYEMDTDPIYASVPFHLVLRGGMAHGVFLDNSFRSKFDIGHQSQGLISFGADGGELDYYFVYGPTPKQVIARYADLTGRMPVPPLWSLGYHQCRYSYYPEREVRFIAENFRVRRIPADTIWLDIHYQEGYVTLDGNALRRVEAAADSGQETAGWTIDDGGFVVVAAPDRFSAATIVVTSPAASP